MRVPNAIAVLVSTSRHPLSGLPCSCHNDSLALEAGRRISAGALRVLHAGDPSDPALLDYLAFGAAVVEVLPAAQGDDIVPLLTEQLRDARLVLCGTRSQAGAASGMLPYLLGTALGLPVLTDVLDVKRGPDSVQAVQFLPKGRRRQVELPQPAIVALHPLAAPAPRYAYARRTAGRVETLPAWAPPDTDVRMWRVDMAERLPAKLTAPDRRSGHARMAAAIGTVQQSGGQVVIEGSSVAKAQAVLAYLREHGIIDLPGNGTRD
jgi:electron transfer flavoprotein beta subunit